MKIEEITKKIIEELKNSNQLNFDENSDEFEYKKDENSKYFIDDAEKIEYENLQKLEENSENLKEHEEINSVNILSQEEFLQKIKERILVLFEGLNNFDRDDIEARVELSLKFMEFLLANIDKRISDIQKQ
ncbi:CiaD-like domain-containing protein [Campylobacter ureolyticus]|uniref:Campylobacter invasion antigen D C-terminal domain-containing protein n=1 Tax=Campylobacter ureolyticus TaxID=827 RepID=A0A9Q4KPI1_9BACT|nr:hypothetical protein [Campylobacter ureolyticus]MCZ6160288.1 hypothetical protein [Campylobacter ureolyticus]MCZ6164020.1 hypothetical protein [Campylobacter ureolyticus]MCZ6165990.1 hypothetical protein [Campylobacter ureolyticus]MCZ6167557.1 hypothetical protein [Campylobacter ureolyticus]